MKLWNEDLQLNIFKATKGIVDIYCQSKDMTYFHNLPGKLKHVTLTKLGEGGIFTACSFISCLMQSLPICLYIHIWVTEIFAKFNLHGTPVLSVIILVISFLTRLTRVQSSGFPPHFTYLRYICCLPLIDF